jgi:hypothetical protein
MRHSGITSPQSSKDSINVTLPNYNILPKRTTTNRSVTTAGGISSQNPSPMLPISEHDKTKRDSTQLSSKALHSKNMAASSSGDNKRSSIGSINKTPRV